MNFKAQLMDEVAVTRSMARITHEILESCRGTDGLCLVGIKRRGVPLAEMLAENIRRFDGAAVPLGTVDISLYRDDLSEIAPLPETAGCSIPCDITDKTVVLVDDVIYTGRTVRAAIEAVFAVGRPKKIKLAVLIDRGHRELPIKPDFVGKNVPTSHDEQICVLVREIDGECRVCLGGRREDK